MASKKFIFDRFYKGFTHGESACAKTLQDQCFFDDLEDPFASILHLFGPSPPALVLFGPRPVKRFPSAGSWIFLKTFIKGFSKGFFSEPTKS